MVKYLEVYFQNNKITNVNSMMVKINSIIVWYKKYIKNKPIMSIIIIYQYCILNCNVEIIK